MCKVYINVQSAEKLPSMTQHYAKISSNSCASSLGEAKLNSKVYLVNIENHTEFSSRKQNQNITAMSQVS